MLDEKLLKRLSELEKKVTELEKEMEAIRGGNFKRMRICVYCGGQFEGDEEFCSTDCRFMYSRRS